MVKRETYKFLYRIYKKNARRRNLPFSLDFSLFLKLVSSNCFYCGLEPINTLNPYLTKDGKPNDKLRRVLKIHNRNMKNIKNKTIKYNGIDRKNNSKGYIKTNVVTCCKECNRIKWGVNYNIFIKWIKRIIKHNKGINGTN